MRILWLRQLYIQVIIDIVAGATRGFISSSPTVTPQPLADAFLKPIRMLLAPVIFATVALGIKKMSDIKEVGRIGVRAILYFEIVSTLALAIEPVVVNVIRLHPSLLNKRQD